MKYMDNFKHNMFPEIKDWSDPQDDRRYDNNILGMPWKYWFFFSPYNFKLLWYGFPIVSIMIFLPISLLLMIHEAYFPLAITLLITAHQGKRLYDKYRMRHMTKNTNFYDLWMREEPR